MSETRAIATTGAEIIRQPTHKYRNNYPESVVEAFGMFAASCADTLSDSSLYPNATIQIEPSPTYMKSGVLTFAAIWGRATEMPSLKQEKIAEYFGSAALGLRFKRKPQELTTLDGNGFIGAVSVDKKDRDPRLSVIVGKKDSKRLHVESYPLLDTISADHAMIDILAKLIIHRPLRFSQGVRWVPYNGYFGCTFADQDEHKAQEVLLSRV